MLEAARQTLPVPDDADIAGEDSCVEGSRTEFGNDEHVMAAIGAQYPTVRRRKTQTDVLTVLTGDGNHNGHRSTGPGCVPETSIYTAICNCVFLKGVLLELCAWRGGTNLHYVDMQKHFPHLAKIIYFDDMLQVHCQDVCVKPAQ